MQVIEIRVPCDAVPGIKKAAREFDIDFTDSPPADGHVIFHFMILDLFDLILIGMKYGANKAWMSMEEPLKEIIDKMEINIKKTQEENNNESSRLG